MTIALALLLVLMTGAVTPAVADKPPDALLFDLQLVPLDGQAPPAFELERLADGKKVTLAEQRGRPVMLYFWATW